MYRPIEISSLIKNLIKLSRYVYDRGYTVANGGNISARVNESFILIKKSGSSLGRLIPADLLIVPLSKENVPKASIDYPIHRAIYLNTNSKYVLHVHPVNVISFSLKTSKCFTPCDFESKYYLGECVPIIEGEHYNIYKKIGELSQNNNTIIEKTHGIYVHGMKPIEILYQVERLEHAVNILLTSGDCFK